MTSILVGVGGILLLFLVVVVVGVVVLVKVFRGRNATTPPPATSTATPTTPKPAPKTVKEALLPYALWLVILGVVGIVGIGFLAYTYSSSFDWKLWLPIAVVLAGAINGLRYAGKNSVWLTVIVVVGCLAWLGMYAYYGDKAPEVAKTIRERNYKKFQNPEGATVSARENADEKTEWVVTNLPVQLPVDDQGIYVPDKWSSPWEKPRGADQRCEYYSDVGVGRWYAIKTGENERPLDLKDVDKFVRLGDSVKTYYFKILLEGKKGFEVIQRCPA